MTSFTGKFGYSVEIIADRGVRERKNAGKTYIKMPNKNTKIFPVLFFL